MSLDVTQKWLINIRETLQKTHDGCIYEKRESKLLYSWFSLEKTCKKSSKWVPFLFLPISYFGKPDIWFSRIFIASMGVKKNASISIKTIN
jgi:hypothetical protein